MLGSLPSSSAVSPQMEPKHRFWFRKLSTEWRESQPQANTSKYGEKNLMKNTYPASGANAEGSNDMPWDGANNVRLECRMHQAGYIDGTNERGGNWTAGQTPRKWRRTHTGQKALT
jgi:hypothetical protein